MAFEFKLRLELQIMIFNMVVICYNIFWQTSHCYYVWKNINSLGKYVNTIAVRRTVKSLDPI